MVFNPGLHLCNFTKHNKLLVARSRRNLEETVTVRHASHRLWTVTGPWKEGRLVRTPQLFPIRTSSTLSTPRPFLTPKLTSENVKGPMFTNQEFKLLPPTSWPFRDPTEHTTVPGDSDKTRASTAHRHLTGMLFSQHLTANCVRHSVWRDLSQATAQQAFHSLSFKGGVTPAKQMKSLNYVHFI